MDNEIQIRFLDHVAIRVLDLNKSVEWYENVLNLKKYQKPEWGEFPVMMVADFIFFNYNNYNADE